ncbi:hypothetical protein [Pseudomonas sp. NUPR-001]
MSEDELSLMFNDHPEGKALPPGYHVKFILVVCSVAAIVAAAYYLI